MVLMVIIINSFLTDPDINLQGLNVFNLVPFYSYIMLWAMRCGLLCALCGP